MAQKIAIFDSTLRDGAQGEGISFSMEDKLNIVRAMDRLGVDYIEAGIPGANPKDTAFFQEAPKRLQLRHAKLVAFGSTRRRDTRVEDDYGCRNLAQAGTPAVTVFGKCWDLHVTDVLQTTLAENLRMVEETVAYLAGLGKEVIFDGEHFFDGYLRNPAYAMEVLAAAQRAGAAWLVLCDTNGGTFPQEIGEITARVGERLTAPLGIHCHNDTGCAVAASVAAVRAGATQVQGTYTGFGERCGNCCLSTVIGNLQLKLGYTCIPQEKLAYLTKTAGIVSEIANLRLPGTTPYVGRSAFAHKGGMHVDGVYKNAASFEHIDPELVGNRRNVLLSEASGRSAIARRISEIDSSITRDSLETAQFIQKLKEKEQEGYEFESAGASLEIFALKHLGKYVPAFQLEYFKIIGEQPAVLVERSSTALIKVRVGDRMEMTAAEGEGPVHAMDVALRRALEVFYPSLRQMRLVDYKVRVMETSAATAAKVRVLIESSDGENVWTTVGMSADIIDASWQALRDSIEYKLLQDKGKS